jgi:hypothetical protein
MLRKMLESRLLTEAQQIVDLDIQLYSSLVRSEEIEAETTCRFLAKSQAVAAQNIIHLFNAGLPISRLQGEAIHDHLMLLRAAGSYTLVDEVVLSSMFADTRSLHLEIAITRVESADGEPAPAAMFLLLPLNETITASETLRISFTASLRSFHGSLRSLSTGPADFVLSLKGSRHR